MTKTNYRNNRIAILLGLVVLLLAVAVQSVFAADVKTMPDLREDDGTLTIETFYADEDVRTPISGMELTIYKVATLSVNEGKVKYTLTEEFSEAAVDVNNLSTEASISAAGIFRDIVKAKGLTGVKAVSQNGYASFGAIPHGIYLVMQTGASGQALQYSAIPPYIIMAPQPTVVTVENEDVEWNYDVVSVPKTVLDNYDEPPTIEQVEEKDSKVQKEYVNEEEPRRANSAKTGDYTQIVAWVAVLAIAACIIVIFAIRRRRNNA